MTGQREKMAAAVLSLSVHALFGGMSVLEPEQAPCLESRPVPPCSSVLPWEMDALSVIPSFFSKQSSPDREIPVSGVMGESDMAQPFGGVPERQETRGGRTRSIPSGGLV